MEAPGGHDGSWTLLTRDPDARIRDISTAVDLTERTVQAIVSDLEAAGDPTLPLPPAADRTTRRSSHADAR